MVLLHGRGRTHAVEHLVLLAILLNHLAAALIVSGQHAPEHNKVCPGAKRLGHVSGAGTAAVRDNVTVQAMGSVSTLDDGTQLWIAHAGLFAGGADRTGANAHLDDVCPGE
uniref:Putative secreted protein n=1 Tax=Ixodes ricinus TaxID=34613 RepID=A0A6B0UJ88_IXORI